MLSAGNKLVATARRKETLSHLRPADYLLALDLDVTSEDEAGSAVAAALDRFGRINVLVNNAGYGLVGAIEETSSDEIEGIFRTNVFGLLNVTRAVLPVMRRQRSGHILNMSSLGGYQASAGFGIYGSTKFAVEGITEALHSELELLGVHVTVIEPGFFRTNFMDGSSLQHTKKIIEDYADTVGKTRSFVSANNKRQPGDPAKLGLPPARALMMPPS